MTELSPSLQIKGGGLRIVCTATTDPFWVQVQNSGAKLCKLIPQMFLKLFSRNCLLSYWLLIQTSKEWYNLIKPWQSVSTLEPFQLNKVDNYSTSYLSRGQSDYLSSLYLCWLRMFATYKLTDLKKQLCLDKEM